MDHLLLFLKTLGTFDSGDYFAILDRKMPWDNSAFKQCNEMVGARPQLSIGSLKKKMRRTTINNSH